MILRGRREEVVVHSETERRGAEGVELGVGLGEVESGVVVDETDLFWKGGGGAEEVGRARVSMRCSGLPWARTSRADSRRSCCSTRFSASRGRRPLCLYSSPRSRSYQVEKTERITEKEKEQKSEFQRLECEARASGREHTD